MSEEQMTPEQAAPHRVLPKRALHVATYLQEWRNARLLTQDQLAERSKTARATIERAERKEGITGRVLHKLADGLGISVVQLQHEDPRFHVQRPLELHEGK